VVFFITHQENGNEKACSSVIPLMSRGNRTILALFSIVLTASQVVLAADSVPKFDVDRACRSVAEVAGMPGRDAPACQRDEQDARNTLQKDWAQYGEAQQSRCVGLVSTGGAPSYVELLTCLEMAKHAEQVREKPKNETVGQH
jgi:hypothetical protein